jgi:hypothetical protein
VRILLSNSITQDDLEVAQEFINLFTMLYEEYYGKLSWLINA